MTPFYLGNHKNCQERYSKKNMILGTILICFILISVFTYLIEVNSVSTYSFKIDGLKERVNEMKTNNQDLKIDLSKADSMDNLGFVVEQLKLVKADKAEYLTLPAVAMAVK